jgi:hypothetical protein
MQKAQIERIAMNTLKQHIRLLYPSAVLLKSKFVPGIGWVRYIKDEWGNNLGFVFREHGKTVILPQR